MRVAAWLVWRDLSTRRRGVAVAASVVAVTVAFCVSVELVSRSREVAVAARIDEIGAPIRIVPEGVTAGALSRLQIGSRLLPEGLAEQVRRAVPGLRALEARLVLEAPVGGRNAPLVGTSLGYSPPGRNLRPGEVALGSVLAARVGEALGAEIPVGRARWRVAAVLPSTASMDDLAAFVPLVALQELAGLPDAANELRLYLRPGASVRIAEMALRGLPVAMSIVRSDRGEVADRDAQESLLRHRRTVYVVTAAVVALCLLIGAHLDASERRTEMATLVAVGSGKATVLAAVLIRSAMVGLMGGAAGLALGVAIAFFQDPAAFAPEGVGPVAAGAIAAAAGLGLVAGVPVAVLAVRRDPVANLQEF